MTALGDYLRDNSISYADFARRVGADKSQIQRCATGQRGPGVALAFAIEKATDGAVPASSWLKRKNRRRAA